MIDILSLIDISIKFFGVLAVITGVYQLQEMRTRRRADLYFKIAESYYTKEMDESRNAIHAALSKLSESSNNCVAPDSGDSDIIDQYIVMFHDADGEMKDIDVRIRKRIRFLNQVGILVKKNLIDKDLTFELIGGGFEVDRNIILIALAAHRKAHRMPLYSYIEYLETSYDKYRRGRMRA